MSIQSDFFVMARALVGDRVYPDGTAPAYTDTYMTYSRISENEQHSVDTNGGIGNLLNTRLQVDIYSTSFAAAQAAKDALRSGLKAWAVTNVILSNRDMYEADTKLHRVMFDISTWHY